MQESAIVGTATATDDRFGVTEARIRAAALLRRLGHGFVRHDAPDDLFEQLIKAILPVVERLETGTERNRSLVGMGDGPSMFGEPPADGVRLSHFPDCVVSGAANPMGVAIEVRCEGVDAVAETVLGAAFEGAPGRAHGGVVAAIFDDVMGYVLSIHKVPAFTGRLAVTYRAPTPIGAPLIFRARLGMKLIAEATATFVVIPIERFMPGFTEVQE